MTIFMYSKCNAQYDDALNQMCKEASKPSPPHSHHTRTMLKAALIIITATLMTLSLEAAFFSPGTVVPVELVAGEVAVVEDGPMVTCAKLVVGKEMGMGLVMVVVAKPPVEIELGALALALAPVPLAEMVLAPPASTVTAGMEKFEQASSKSPTSCCAELITEAVGLSETEQSTHC
jgi:hypothetical protein